MSRTMSIAGCMAQRMLPRPIGSISVPSLTLLRQCRAMSTGSVPANPKPRASTPLRRDANASLPIRSNPTPTRGTIQPVITLSTAERFILPRLRPVLSHYAQPLVDAWWIPRWSPSEAPDAPEGEIFIFSNGSFVCWGLPEAEVRRFAKDVIQKANIEVGQLKEHETEELDFVTDPTEKTRLQGDLIILGSTSPLSSSHNLPSNASNSVLPLDTVHARYAFSHALARSTALSAIEVSLDDFLSSVAQLPHSLAQTGKPGLGRKDLIKKLGLLMQFRQGLNLNRENFSDTPDFYWGEPVLEGYFNSVNSALEMRGRLRSVNDKITYAAEVQSTLRQLLTESSGHRMELIIIALIAVEVILALIREGPELAEWTHGMLFPEPTLKRQEGPPA